MTMIPSRRIGVFAILTAVVLLGLLLHGPITQPQAYHQFADQRSYLGLANFSNVVSNIPMFIAGLFGLYLLHKQSPAGVLPELFPAYRIFFAGSALIAVGSIYYHLNPDDASLIWDRLPMTLAFMAFFAIILGEHFSPATGQRFLYPLLIAGAGSIAYWWLSQDLRLYILVQFLPILLIPAILLLFPSRLNRIGYHWAVLACYGIAKVFEQFDQDLLDSLAVSGHTLKHLTSACAIGIVCLAVRNRHAP